VFKHRLDDVLRDVEIGFVNGAGFERVEQLESKEEWIKAAEAVRLLKPAFGTYNARMTICKRAHSGMLRSRAQRLMVDGKKRDDFEIPKEFWWAEGHHALEQNWAAGDFETWVHNGKRHLEAFGVSFLRGEIEKLIPNVPASSAPMPRAAAAPGGRPAAEWWDDLWIEICRQLYGGELIPKKQADIEKAMTDWLANRDEHPSGSTIRRRARKLWHAIKDEGENWSFRPYSPLSGRLSALPTAH
jgi:hypothetical protein